jgi:hypothetical protein
MSVFRVEEESKQESIRSGQAGPNVCVKMSPTSQGKEDIVVALYRFISAEN